MLRLIGISILEQYMIPILRSDDDDDDDDIDDDDDDDNDDAEADISRLCL